MQPLKNFCSCNPHRLLFRICGEKEPEGELVDPAICGNSWSV